MRASPARVAARYLRASTTCLDIKGNDRLQYLNAVWAMYVLTYKAIGMGVKSSHELLSEFPSWDLCLDEAGIPRTFTMFKNTTFGMKFSLAGSDGTPEGKGLVVNGARTVFKRNGYYGEVSHKLKDIALASGAPVVCAVYAAKVLGKHVEPQEDGVSYARTITGVGHAVKVLVGKPKGIPTTDWQNPHCPVGVTAAWIEGSVDDAGDLCAHYASVAM